MIEEYTRWFENLEIYRGWMRNLPEPFNNVAFASAAFLIALLFLISAIVNRILVIRWNASQRKARRHLELERLRDQEEERERLRQKREDREQMEMYLRFLMTAQMQNFTSLQGITFEQWKIQMAAAQTSCRDDTAGREQIGDREQISDQEQINDIEQIDDCDTVGGRIQDTGNPQETGESQLGDMESDPEHCEQTESTDSCVISEEESTTPCLLNGDFGFTAEEDELESFSGSIALPEVRLPDEKESEEDVPEDTLTSVSYDALMEQIEQNRGSREAVEELSVEQQSDFAKVIARMREDAEKQEDMEHFRREKSEIIKKNLSALEKSLSDYSDGDTAETNGKRKIQPGDDMERRKALAREALEEAKRQEQEKQEKQANNSKKGIFRRKRG